MSLADWLRSSQYNQFINATFGDPDGVNPIKVTPQLQGDEQQAKMQMALQAAQGMYDPNTNGSGGLLNSPDLRNYYAGLPANMGMADLHGLTSQIIASRFNPKEGFTLTPGQQRFDASGNPVASVAPDETFTGTPVPLKDGRSVIIGSRGTPKIMGGDLTPATKLDFAAPGTTPVNPYTGAASGPALGGFKTLSPQELGIGNDTVSPGTIFQQGPDGRISVVKASDVESPAAAAQQAGLAGSKSAAERATDPLNSIELKLKNGQPLTTDEQKLWQTKNPNAIATDDDAVAHTAQAIANYQIAPLTGMAMRSPFGQAVMAKVTDLNQNFQAQNYTKSVAGYRAFASGKQGDQMRFADNAIGHMNTALQLADALGNGNVPAFNSLAQSFAQNTGSAAPTNFDTAKQIISGEVVKAITGAGGALADRQQAEAAFSRASSPAQLKGAIQTAQTLLARQLQGLGRQYKNSTMRDDFTTLLSPESQALLGGGVTSAAANVPTATGPNGQKLYLRNGQWSAQ